MSISVNARAAILVSELETRAEELRIAVAKGELGEKLIDAGAGCIGGVSAGLSLAKICMGGMGDVSLFSDAASPRWPWSIAVRSSNPVIACLASQYAGWRLSHGEGQGAYFALGSGPARALARKEALFDELSYVDEASEGVLVIEGDRAPPPAMVAKVAADCGLPPSRMTFIYAPTQSLAGGCQVVARVLEVALHKTHELKFPLDRIVDGMERRRCRRRIPISSPRWAAPTTPSSMPAKCICTSLDRRRKPRAWPNDCPARLRATSGGRLRSCSDSSKAIFMRLIRCCSVRPR